MLLWRAQGTWGTLVRGEDVVYAISRCQAASWSPALELPAPFPLQQVSRLGCLCVQELCEWMAVIAEKE